jgi:hypothetical protein
MSLLNQYILLEIRPTTTVRQLEELVSSQLIPKVQEIVLDELRKEWDNLYSKFINNDKEKAFISPTQSFDFLFNNYSQLHTIYKQFLELTHGKYAPLVQQYISCAFSIIWQEQFIAKYSKDFLAPRINQCMKDIEASIELKKELVQRINTRNDEYMAYDDKKRELVRKIVTANEKVAALESKLFLFGKEYDLKLTLIKEIANLKQQYKQLEHNFKKEGPLIIRHIKNIDEERKRVEESIAKMQKVKEFYETYQQQWLICSRRYIESSAASANIEKQLHEKILEIEKLDQEERKQHLHYSFTDFFAHYNKQSPCPIIRTSSIEGSETCSAQLRSRGG